MWFTHHNYWQIFFVGFCQYLSVLLVISKTGITSSWFLEGVLSTWKKDDHVNRFMKFCEQNTRVPRQNFGWAKATVQDDKAITAEILKVHWDCSRKNCEKSLDGMTRSASHKSASDNWDKF